MWCILFSDVYWLGFTEEVKEGTLVFLSFCLLFFFFINEVLTYFTLLDAKQTLEINMFMNNLEMKLWSLLQLSYILEEEILIQSAFFLMFIFLRDRDQSAYFLSPTVFVAFFRPVTSIYHNWVHYWESLPC